MTFNRFDSRRRKRSGLILLVTLTLGGVRMAHAAPPLRTWGAEALRQTDKAFLIPKRSIYAESGTEGQPAPDKPAFAWTSSVQLSALAAAAGVDRSYLPELHRFINGLNVYWTTNQGVQGYDVLPGPKPPDRYYDDNDWITLALIDSYRASGQYLDRAEATFRFVMSGHDDKLGGGIYWHEQKKTSKNTCSNAPAACAALRLYIITHKPVYKTTGLALYNWTNQHLQDTDGLFFDNVRLDGTIEKTKWSYNSALMIRANCLLYRVTHNKKYLTEAERIARAAEARWVHADTGAFEQDAPFGHYLLEGFLYLYRQDHNRHWSDIIFRGLQYLHDHCRDPEGFYAHHWDTPQQGPLTKLSLMDQACATRAFWVSASILKNSPAPSMTAVVSPPAAAAALIPGAAAPSSPAVTGASSTAAAPTPVPAGSTVGYYRFPSLRGREIVFTAEGDLWRVSVNGGVARRLTTSPREESHAAISPDGRTVAFSASYEGPEGIYLMPIEGGLPKRLTFDGLGAAVQGWTPDGRVLYSTSAFSTLPEVQLAAVNPTTAVSARIPLSEAADGSYDDTGKTLFFTRYAFQGSHTKRYKGGTAQNIWKYTDGAPEAIPLTSDYAGTSKNPMWWHDLIYFLSDRDGSMNLWSMKGDGKDLRQLTHHAGWDAQSPSLDAGRIVYQLGADLYLYDIASDQDQKLNITLESDFDQTREQWLTNPMGYLTALHLSPDGQRVALTARGQVFTAPVKEGRLAEVTRRPGVRYRSARFTADSKSLLVLSDQSGETEWWRFPANGVGTPEQLSVGATVTRTDGIPSPDGKQIAYTDLNHELWIFNIADRRATRIARSEYGGYSDLKWSPDSR